MFRVNVHVAQSLFKDDVLKIMHLYLTVIITLIIIIICDNFCIVLRVFRAML